METHYEFDTLYATDGKPQETAIPRVEADEKHDILIDGVPLSLSGWFAITHKTGQYGYRGAVMHPSETASAETVRQWVEDAGGHTFAIVAVESCEHPEPEGHDLECACEVCSDYAYCQDAYCDSPPAGWAVIYLAG